MERFLTFYLANKLSCHCSPGSIVTLCLEEDLLSPTDCAETEGSYAGRFLDAELMGSGISTDSCTATYWYEVKYDDSYLVSYDEEAGEAETPLRDYDVLGAVCQDCLTDWMKYLIGSAVTATLDEGVLTITNQYGCEYEIPLDISLALTVDDTNTIDLTLAGNQLSADLRIDNTETNLLSQSADGALVPPFTVTDTSSIDFTTSVGGGVQNLTGTVKISANAGNIITQEADGIFAEDPTPISVDDTASVDLTLASNVITADVLLSADGDNILTIEADGLKSDGYNSTVDSNSIAFTPSVNQLEANVKLSVTAGNIITELGDGLYAAGSFTTSNTPSVTLTLTGSDLEADVEISADADNLITIEADGLYADGIDTVTDTASVDLTKTGNTLTADVKLSATGGNIITMEADGIYAVGAGSVAVDDTATLDLTLSAGVITGDVLISADADNIMTIESDGLKVVAVTTGVDTPTIDISVTGDSIEADVVLSADSGNVLTEESDGLHASIQTILNAVYPVGSIIESVLSTNPASYAIPYPGTWVEYGVGRVTICVAPFDGTINVSELLVGNETVNLSHYHRTAMGTDTAGTFYSRIDGSNLPIYGSDAEAGVTRHTVGPGSTGTGSARLSRTDTPSVDLTAVSVRQPSITVYRWRRTA